LHDLAKPCSSNKPRFSGNGTSIALGELCEILNGYAFKSKRYVDEGIRVIRIANVQKGYLEDSHPCFYPATEKGSIAQFLLYENDLLLSLTGNVGRVALLDNKFLPAALNQRVACLRIKDESLLNKRYLFHCLNSMCFENRCIESANGIAQKNLSTVWLRGYAIPVPQMDKQLEIARRFDLMQAQISRAKAQIVKLDSLVKSRFIEMFEVYAREGNTAALSELCEFVTVGIANAATHAYANDGIVMLRNLNVRENHLDDSDLIKINPNFAAKYSKKALKAGDVLVTRTGYPGIACVVPEKYAGCQTFTTLIARLKSNAQIIPLFLSFWINSPAGKEFVERMKAGSSQQNFGATSLKLLEVPLPPLELQQEFASFVSQVDKLRFKTQQQIEKLEMLKASLMQEYFE
jgi:type I restriction enzyme S subunit